VRFGPDYLFEDRLAMPRLSGVKDAQKMLPEPWVYSLVYKGCKPFNAITLSFP